MSNDKPASSASASTQQPSSSASTTTSTPAAMSTPILAVSCRMLRSPSHESFTTDNSLFSISTLALDIGSGFAGGCAGGGVGGRNSRGISFRELRGSSPHPEFAIDPMTKRPFDIIPEGVWFEESNDLIRSCALLSATLGIQKSFSTSDITQLPGPPDLLPLRSRNGRPNAHTNDGHAPHNQLQHQQQHAMSELALNSLQRCGYMLDNPRLDHASRSCSTWVAVGELASASQLPSPHGGPASQTAGTGGAMSLSLATGCTPPPQPEAPAFTAADLIRSVNKKVRQNYIRRRLLTTYRALERLSQSEFNLDRLEAEAAAATELLGPGPTELVVPTTTTATVAAGATVPPASTPSTIADETLAVHSTLANVPTVATAEAAASKSGRITLDAATAIKQKIINITQTNSSSLMTIDDIEKERGKPLSKYDRNMMIFNWLHSLDEEVADEAAAEEEKSMAVSSVLATPMSSLNVEPQ